MSTAQPVATEQSRKLRVFLCHASGDKQFVRDLYRRLIDDGFAPWLDEKELLPGQRWQEEIPRAVRASDVVIVCLSQKSVDKEGYIQREIRFALDEAEEKPEGTIFIIPARIEEVEVPHRLSEWQWANLFDNDGYGLLVAALSRRAQALNLPKYLPPQPEPAAVLPKGLVPDKTNDHPNSLPNRPVEPSPASPDTPSLQPDGGTDMDIKLSPDQMYNKAENYWIAKNYKEGLLWYEKAAAGGNANAMAALGTIHESGKGVTQNYEKARSWYRKAADAYQEAATAGVRDAMYNLGFLYESGCGVKQDYQRARHWYQQAAEVGDPMGMTSLGTLFDRGVGVKRDYQQARYWYQKAAEAGDSTGMANLGVLYESGKGVPQQDKEAWYWFQKAAEAGNRDGMRSLASLYAEGRGVPQDYQRARYWYKKAAAAGDADARRRLEELPE